MKVVDKDTAYFSKIEHYDLCDGHYEAVGKGLVICYMLVTYKDCLLKRAEFEAEHEEIGVPKAWHYRYDKARFDRTFEFLDTFLQGYDDDDFGKWTVIVEYKGIDVVVSGVRERTEIGVSYPKEENLDLEKLFKDIETLTCVKNPYFRGFLTKDIK